jgi:SAM-dependent methyltransferase
MAIGSMHADWLSSLAKRSAIPANAEIIELGPQDLWLDRASVQLIARRHLGSSDCERAVSEIFDGETPRRDAQLAFYRIFGASDYKAVDLEDSRAQFRFDLNWPLPKSVGTFDVVTNYGTTEHVFDIAQTFRSMHQLLRAGGLQLHTLPAFAAIDHGFYNIHPTAYLDMARANNYDVVDVSYIDNINFRMARPIGEEPFDFASLPIQLPDMKDTNDFMTKATLLFCENVKTVVEAPPDPRYPLHTVFDMLFVALRKTPQSPRSFVLPTQSIYGSAPTKRPLGGKLRDCLETL